MSGRVAVIGAGPCGLSQLQAFESARRGGARIPEIVCFEKQTSAGGLWNYDWRTGTDAYGEPIHAGMYRYLWSNGPKECLEFADYTFAHHFGQPIPSFPPRPVLADYVLGRAKAFGLRRYIETNTVVRQVSFDQDAGSFAVTVRNRDKDEQRTEHFSHVIVASGHFSVPNIPHYEGIESFPGRVMHGHDFREAREFKGRHVLVVGGSYSAEDIALQCHKYGAASVTISYRSAAMGFHWPDTVDERALLASIDGAEVSFSDGSAKEFDAIIFCTGYLHHFPFLDDELRLRTGNRLYPADLYKGIFWRANPKLMYLGMQDQFYTFSMFDLQAWYARDVVMGRIGLPDGAAMDADMAAWSKREEALPDPIAQIDFQTDYCKDLHELVDYPHFDLQLLADNFKEWEHDKEHDILTYRDKAFRSACTGVLSPVHHTTWLEALDDSREAYLACG
ncbi:MAG: SidA/IucD/PvdA family monooxygenase [Gammaproteobacteria bacterium]|nr:SidA/IucD/PvdA family monooxygenase [Gammaproteobacteria bacterium]